MTVLPDGRVWLEKGEIVPVHCNCGHVYQPKSDSKQSTCPKCLTLNIHGERGRWREVPTQIND